MKKIFPLLAALGLALSAAAAQSGRRLPPSPPTQTPPQLEPHTAPPAAAAAAEEGSYGGRLPPPVGATRYVPETVLGRELRGVTGGSFRLADFGGKVLVVNLWASWCGPCRREIPELKEVHSDYSARGVEFIGLTIEDPRSAEDKVKQFVRDFKMSYRVAWAERDMARALAQGHNVIPQTFVIDGDGRVVRHLRGYARGHTADALRAALDRALESK